MTLSSTGDANPDGRIPRLPIEPGKLRHFIIENTDGASMVQQS